MTATGTPEQTSPLRSASSAQRSVAIDLFLTGFLVLFFELACIRWFAAYVVFLQFFTNVVLIAAFLGMSCGCMAARRNRDWLRLFPYIGLAAVAIAMRGVYHYWSGFAISVGDQAAPQEVFFGTENRNPDVAQFAIPIEYIAAVFFLFVAFMFVGLGQVLGRAFDAYANRVLGYSLNIGGSLAGVAAFSALSFAQAPPIAWFLVAGIGIAYLLHKTGSLSRWRGLALILVVAGAGVPADWFFPQQETRWSPYYMVERSKTGGSIEVNTIGHQTMVPFDASGATYSLIHLLRRHSGGPPFQDELIIGAGSGNDIAHALHAGVGHIDAVEIDPVIQDIGIHFHPDHPYQDRRVVPHLDDGRHFLRTTDHKYDLVVYALVDSLVLHSGYANIRLESYLFTQEAFQDVRNVLKPGGTFVMYNYFRQGWIVQRVAAMAQEVFGCAPIVLSLPYLERVEPATHTGFTMIIAGCNQNIADAFRQHPAFWLNTVPPVNDAIDGFAIDPATLPPTEAKGVERIAPSTLADTGTGVSRASDDWPFLYILEREIPNLTVRSSILLGVLGIGMVYLFLPKGRLVLSSRMFFLGAAFMLLETKAVVQMALLFGSTWLVNSLVFFAVLVLLLFSNLYVLKMPGLRLWRHYVGLLLVLAIDVLIPLDLFISGGLLWRYAVPCVLTLGPMFFAGVIFARSFRDEREPDQAFGSNIAGAVVGGLSESLSMILGFRYLLLVAIAFYLLSAWTPRIRGAPGA